MPLFAVKRYAHKKQQCIDEETEKKRLAELLSKVQKRKENIKLKRLKSHTVAAAKAEKKIKIRKNANSVADKGAVSKASVDETENESTAEISFSTEQSSVHPSSAAATADKVSEDMELKALDFTVIGRDRFKKVKRLKAPLPKWLAKPKVVSADMGQKIVKIDEVEYLSSSLKETLEQQNVHNLFAVQWEVIPWLLQEYENSLAGYWPRDLCVSAPTGSGKTLAFALPIIQILQSRTVCEIRALVLLPTQILARQVFQVFHTYCKRTCLKVVLASGQVPMEKEQAQLVSQDSCGFHSLADIFVTTPGRLVHHIRDTPGFSLKHLRFLVVDEADRVMDGAQNNWLYHLDQHLESTTSAAVGHQPCQAPVLTVANLRKYQPTPQKLLFSATITHDPEKLSQLGLFQPKLFTFIVKNTESAVISDEGVAPGEEDLMGQFAMPAEIQEFNIICEDEGAKPLLLFCLVLQKRQKVLCFTSTRLAAHRLALLLSEISTRSKQQCLVVAEISADLYIHERDAILAKFSRGEIDIIICSDALARGIDIPEVDCVVSYDVPQLTQQYVHRMGRTGRAGRRGTAITIINPHQQGAFEHLLRCTGRLQTVQNLEPPMQQMESFEKIYCEALISVKKKIQTENFKTLILSKSKRNKIGIKNKKNLDRAEKNNKSRLRLVERKRKKLKNKVKGNLNKC